MTHGFGARIARMTGSLATRLLATAGVTMVEYSFVLVLVSIIAVTVIAAIGGRVTDMLKPVVDAFS